MNSEGARQNLRRFIEKHLPIDAWGTNFPANIDDSSHPPSIAREEAEINDIGSEGFSNGMGSPNPLVARVRFDFTIMYRFPDAYLYEDLLNYRRQAADILLLMISRLRQQPTCLHPEFDQIDATGSVGVAQSENKDWILFCKFSATVWFEVELDELGTASDAYFKLPTLL